MLATVDRIKKMKTHGLWQMHAGCREQGHEIVLPPIPPHYALPPLRTDSEMIEPASLRQSCQVVFSDHTLSNLSQGGRVRRSRDGERRKTFARKSSKTGTNSSQARSARFVSSTPCDVADRLRRGK
jgi:hypothetical protein